MMPVVDKHLSSNTESIQQARQSVTDLGDQLSARERQDLNLLISELVTNSVLHAGLLDEDLIGLKIYLSVELIHTEVRNPGSGFELPLGSVLGGGLLDNLPDINQTSGWGLQLVAQLADRWGIDSEDVERMTLVWFDMDRDPG